MPGSLRKADKSRLGMRIEAASEEALPAVQAMAAASGAGPSWPEEGWGKYLQAAAGEGLGWLLLLARGEGGELWGWLAASRVWERSELDYVLVHPAHRGRGIGGALVDGWMAWSRMQGATELALEVRVSNEGPARLYRRKGFQEQGRRPKYYQMPQEDALLMGRKLEATSGVA